MTIPLERHEFVPDQEFPLYYIPPDSETKVGIKYSNSNLALLWIYAQYEKLILSKARHVEISNVQTFRDFFGLFPDILALTKAQNEIDHHGVTTSEKTTLQMPSQSPILNAFFEKQAGQWLYPIPQEIAPETLAVIDLGDLLHSLKNTVNATNIKGYMLSRKDYIATQEDINRIGELAHEFRHQIRMSYQALTSPESYYPQARRVSIGKLKEKIKLLFEAHFGAVENRKLEFNVSKVNAAAEVFIDEGILAVLFENVMANSLIEYRQLAETQPDIVRRIEVSAVFTEPIVNESGRIIGWKERKDELMTAEMATTPIAIITDDFANGFNDTILVNGLKRGTSTHEGGQGIGLSGAIERLNHYNVAVILRNHTFFDTFFNKQREGARIIAIVPRPHDMSYDESQT
jgi:hypothetical protein